MAARRKKTIDEQIEYLDEQIQKIKEKLDTYIMNSKYKIKEMEIQKQELIERKRTEKVQRIYDLMQEKGISITELEAILSK